MSSIENPLITGGPVMLEKELQLEFFKKNGYVRKKCKKCGKYFWTLNPNLEICMDSPCTEYQFIGNPITKKKYTLKEMREAFLSFFEKHGHKRIRRYPVVARWRDDIYFTIASIADFQPHVTSGEAEPPANPLVISQPCIRFTDIDAVGKSGRHLTNFEMMAHHAFNKKDNYVYWKEETVEYALKFFTEELGIPKEEIVFKENPWFGGGNAGAAFEVVSRGLEIATLVFMNLKEDPNGEIELGGSRYSPMDLYIVDTGYGLERLVWFSTGDPTIYDAIYGDIVDYILEKAGKPVDRRDEQTRLILAEFSKMAALIDVDFMGDLTEFYNNVHKRLKERYGLDIPVDNIKKIAEIMSKVYGVADHTRALVFILGDGVVPSNMREGYFARMLIRRSVRMLYELGLKPEFLWEIMDRHIEHMKEDYPELYSVRETIRKIIEIEIEKYKNTLERGRNIVIRIIKSKGKIDVEDLVELYDSHGITPEIVKEIASSYGKSVEIPPKFYALIAERHSRAEIQEEIKERIEIPQNLPETRLLYYEDEYLKEFDAIVIWSKDNYVILDQTAFYPTGGGQEHDTGILSLPDGTEVHVKNVFKEKRYVVHEVDKKIHINTKVRGRIDCERRYRLMRHHTATHVILTAARRVLGPHVWQAGAEKTPERVRFDITHFERLTDEDVKKIEEEANKIVWSGYQVIKKWIPRKIAEEKYGFRLYQGGVPPGAEIRVVMIGSEDDPIDAQACGGKHLNNTLEVGIIKIFSTDRIQDGVVRLEFAAGPAALEHIQNAYDQLRHMEMKLNTKVENILPSFEKMLQEYHNVRKEAETLKKRLAEIESKVGWEEIGEIKGYKILYKRISGELEDAVNIAGNALKELNSVILICTDSGFFVLGRPRDAEVDLREIAKKLR
ncbi:MAG TPA: alanine--tRNA ligase, partial [Euryarchaeota archaeon]|nr:alanine--tRNA ligase [Euryarchaeota archaeon]